MLSALKIYLKIVRESKIEIEKEIISESNIENRFALEWLEKCPFLPHRHDHLLAVMIPIVSPFYLALLLGFLMFLI